jgi:hypothetical protein
MCRLTPAITRVRFARRVHGLVSDYSVMCLMYLWHGSISAATR